MDMNTPLCENRRKFLAVSSYLLIHQGFFLCLFIFLIMQADNFLAVTFTLCHCQLKAISSFWFLWN